MKIVSGIFHPSFHEKQIDFPSFVTSSAWRAFVKRNSFYFQVETLLLIITSFLLLTMRFFALFGEVIWEGASLESLGNQDQKSSCKIELKKRCVRNK